MLSKAALRVRQPGARGPVLCFLLCFLWGLAYPAAAQPNTGPAVPASPGTGGPFSAAGIGTGTRPISGLWQFHLGDDPAWAQPGFDDHAWEQLPADQPWGDVGYPGYAGFAWYRRQITLDPVDKTPLALLLPLLGSVAEVYWNGVKVGGIGTPPPHAQWPHNPEPVAVPLPPTPGARSGELAIRLWEHRLSSNDEPDAGGFQAAPLLGYAPLIGKMPGQWWEHLLRARAAAYACHLLVFFVAVAALVLWTRSRSQWVLLAVGLYCLNPISVLFYNLPLSFLSGTAGYIVGLCLSEVGSIFLILLLADLPRRAGVRGAQFWWKACIIISLIDLSSWLANVAAWSFPLLFHFGDVYSNWTGYVYSFFVPVLLLACFLLSELTLPRFLFLSAVGVDELLHVLSNIITSGPTKVGWLSALMQRPVLRIYGSTLSIFTVDRLLVLLAIVYAVSDQIGRQVARQRFVDAEMKAAQEIQQVLVPAAAERQAPGYAVSSVYRPASEVGGDFFQIIPLPQKDGTLATLVVAGDVSGKGLRAAMTVSLVVGTLRTLAEYDPTPAAVLAGLNRRLLGRTQGGFVTCCAVRVDAHGRATMANAGHCQPYLDGHEVDLPNGLPLGLVEGAEYEELAVDVSHGQQLTLLSDGVVEARNHHGELYGFDRLNQLMQQRPTAEHVADTAVGFGQDDDITVLTVTRLATA